MARKAITNNLQQTIPLIYKDENGDQKFYLLKGKTQIVVDESAISQDILDKAAAKFITVGNTTADISFWLKTPFDPNMKSLLGWYDPSFGTTLTEGKVSAWAPKYGTLGSMSGDLLNQSPVYPSPDTYNGIPVIALDGATNTGLAVDGITYKNGFTLIFVAKVPPPAGFNPPPFEIMGFGDWNSQDGPLWFLDLESAKVFGQPSVVDWLDDKNTYLRPVANPNLTLGYTLGVFAFTLFPNGTNGGSFSGFSASTLVGSRVGSDYVPSSPMNTLSVGQGFGSGFGAGWVGDVLIYSAALNDAILLKVIGFFKSKWGIP